MFQNSNFIFGILIQFLEPELLFSEHIYPYYVMIYSSKTGFGRIET